MLKPVVSLTWSILTLPIGSISYRAEWSIMSKTDLMHKVTVCLPLHYMMIG